MDTISGKVIADTAWHAIKRTISVVVVLAFIIGVPWVAYEKGKTKGYSACAKDRPTYGNVGTVYAGSPKPLFLGLKIGRFGIGGIWDRDK